MNKVRKLEICCYSVFSCIQAEMGGADRIELCAGMPEGGTTPSYGTLATALAEVKIPIFVMIRPRGGDFSFNRTERLSMLEDIRALKSLSPGGFVIGALRTDGTLDREVIGEQMEAIGDFPVTFHRAFDMCKDPVQAVGELADLGIQNILTSGLHQRATDGTAELKKIVSAAGDRIHIMAGSGVNPGNILQLAETGVHAFHFSAKKSLASAMEFRNPRIQMGGDPTVDEYLNYEADFLEIQKAKAIIETISASSPYGSLSS
jgi:copper homeostasis protein